MISGSLFVRLLKPLDLHSELFANITHGEKKEGKKEKANTWKIY